MLEIQNLMPSIQIITAGRVPVARELMDKMCRKGLQPRMVMLFNDILIYASEKTTLITQYVSPRVINLHDIKVRC